MMRRPGTLIVFVAFAAAMVLWAPQTPGGEVDGRWSQPARETPAPAWRLSFLGAVPNSVLMGRGHVYFRYGTTNAGPLAAHVADERPTLNDSDDRYDFREVITCVDAASGKMLWTRMTAGRCAIGLDPGTDDVLLWRFHLVRLAADTGEVKEDTKLPDRWRYDAVRVGGATLVPSDWYEFAGKASWHPLPAKARVWDTRLKEAREEDVERLRSMSPDESRTLGMDNLLPEPGHSVVKCARLADGQPLWQYTHDSISANRPFWLGNDVVWLAGWRTRKGEVLRLDGKTGEVRWRLALAEGACLPGYFQQGRGWYNARDWNALAVVGRYLAAVDGKATVHLIEPETGREVGALAGTPAHLTAPRLVGDLLIVAAPDQLKAYRLDAVVRPEKKEDEAAPQQDARPPE